jgi:tetratricopeptide (TPR) repeat protein
MATIMTAQRQERRQLTTGIRVGRAVMLMPELVVFPALCGLYFLTNQAVGVALLGELLIGLFVARIALVWYAGRAWARGSYAQAERLVLWSLRIYPDSADAWLAMGSIQLAQGETEAAIKAIERADQLYPFHAPIYLEMSRALAAHGDWNEARHYASMALVLDEQLALSYSHNALLSLHFDEASQTTKQWIEAGLALAPHVAAKASLYVARAELAFVASDERQVQLALDQAELLLNGCPIPQQAELLYRIGQLQRSLGQVDAARSSFERIEHSDREGGYVHAAWRAKVETSVS